MDKFPGKVDKFPGKMDKFPVSFMSEASEPKPDATDFYLKSFGFRPSFTTLRCLQN